MTDAAAATHEDRLLLRPIDRAIVLVVVVLAVTLGPTLAYPESGIERLQWPDFVMGAITNALAGLISALAPWWRILVGLFVVTPIDQVADIYIGRPNAWSSAKVAKDAIQNAALVWLLPHLDPPQLVLRWMNRASSRLVKNLRISIVYIGYGVWLLVIILALLSVMELAVEFTKLLAGYPGIEGQVFDVPQRIALASVLALIALLVAGVVSLVWFWRRKRPSSTTWPATPRETTAIPTTVAEAVRDSTVAPR